MSYYYSYYLGYKKDNKIYPLGPYNCQGKIRPIISRSRSFASDLHEEFYTIREDAVSDELRKDFEYEDWKGNKVVDAKYLPLDELPSGDYIKKGYCLISDVRVYEENPDDFDGFFDTLSPTVYAAMLDNELKFGKPTPQKDDEGCEYTPHSVSDYMYYAYPDFHCKEYEADFIRTFANYFRNYDIEFDAELVVLETEG